MLETYHWKISIYLNSLVSGSCGSNLESTLKLIMQTSTLGTLCDITPMWMPQILTKSNVCIGFDNGFGAVTQ